MFVAILRSKFKPSRRFNENLWGLDKDPVASRNYGPGVHGPANMRKKKSVFGEQLASKQKVKAYFNIQEKPFRRLYAEALRRRGDTTIELARIACSRLDAVLFNSGLALTIFAAKILISHKKVTVNGKIVNSRGYLVNAGDVIGIIEKARNYDVVKVSLEKASDPQLYLELDREKHTVAFIRAPDSFDEVPLSPVDWKRVIEFYSK